jgi:squalene synthase HpnC
MRAGKSIVIEDLTLFGPSSSNPSMDLGQAKKYCKSLAQRHYENFSVASWLVPAAFRQDFFNIYAYCRWSDDLADEIGNSADSLRLLDWWRAELHACFSGTVKHPVFVALRETITNHSLSIENFEKLLDAFVHDQRVTRYGSHLEVFDYCRGSANPVGRILLQLACVEEPVALKLSDRICSGLQLANFCQDIRLDAQRGRIYLPRDVWQRFQITESEILAGHVTDNLRFALKAWVELARTQLVSGLPLVQRTPRWLARDIQLFARGGLAILNNIARAKYDVWSRPIEVSKRQKLALLLRSVIFPRSMQVAELACPNGSQLA